MTRSTWRVQKRVCHQQIRSIGCRKQASKQARGWQNRVGITVSWRKTCETTSRTCQDAECQVTSWSTRDAATAKTRAHWRTQLKTLQQGLVMGFASGDHDAGDAYFWSDTKEERWLRQTRRPAQLRGKRRIHAHRAVGERVKTGDAVSGPSAAHEDWCRSRRTTRRTWRLVTQAADHEKNVMTGDEASDPRKEHVGQHVDGWTARRRQRLEKKSSHKKLRMTQNVKKQSQRFPVVKQKQALDDGQWDERKRTSTATQNGSVAAGRAFYLVKRAILQLKRRRGLIKRTAQEVERENKNLITAEESQKVGSNFVDAHDGKLFNLLDKWDYVTSKTLEQDCQLDEEANKRAVVSRTRMQNKNTELWRQQDRRLCCRHQWPSQSQRRTTQQVQFIDEVVEIPESTQRQNSWRFRRSCKEDRTKIYQGPFVTYRIPIRII